MKSILQLLGLTAMACMSLSGIEAKQFEDKFGRVMVAELVSHTGADGNIVKIDKDGKKMDVKIDVFSEKDQQFIRDWMKKTPPTLAYAFRVEAVKKKQSEATKSSRSYFSSSKTEVYVYEITVTNLTRQPVSDLRIDHRTVSAGRSKSLKFQRGTETVKGPLRYNEQYTFVSTAKIESASGRSYRGYGSSYSFKESLLGVILRIYGPDGEPVKEWKSPGSRMDPVSWGDSEQSDTRQRGFTGEDDNDRDRDRDRDRGDGDRPRFDEKDIDALRKLLQGGENPFRNRGGNDGGGRAPDVKPEDFSKKFGSR